ncbi:hypothetical protein PG990_001614 [Apiospora arundinis]|uniref:Uncharacterized protein n=1 Tax=Apiospora arundinis TaxID=335852 RepID=A0ABR2HRX3_9PEZI
MAPGVRYAIKHLRLKAIERMLSPFRAALDHLKYISPVGVESAVCYNRNLFFPSQGRCEAFVFGQLQRLLLRKHLLPLPLSEDIEISVAALAQILRTVDSSIEALDSHHNAEVELTKTVIRRHTTGVAASRWQHI